ncbi:competence type IV pilus minor pilin ComGD [Streptococcus equinus]|uniref:competence type IV pilus minor pilin ComGD n=1 Tax=Streptococcus equinus TaxID=1335 RepID=UPI0008D6961B|nr:competence type IV pilus minor pilin ComGD [Streptococcus equinus]SEL19207.1 competence protein ComGD [Streptococcus equinus]
MKKLNLKNKKIRAFTLLESLLTLGLSCFIVIMLSNSVSGIFQTVEEKLFFLSFEHCYRDTQKLASLKQDNQVLTISQDGISNSVAHISLPETVSVVENYKIVFDNAGGNSSLAKVKFQTKNQAIDYQLYIGSGNYKKTETKSLHTP